ASASCACCGRSWRRPSRRKITSGRPNCGTASAVWSRGNRIRAKPPRPIIEGRAGARWPPDGGWRMAAGLIRRTHDLSAMWRRGDTVSLRANLGKTPSKWMLGTGPEPDVAIASRVRLARNVAGIPFPAVASDEQAAKVLRLARDAAADPSPELADLEFIAMADLSPLERRLLVERHLISPQ